MKVALTAWNNRIAPVFDASRSCVVYEVEDTVIIGKNTVSTASLSIREIIGVLKQNKVSAVICGAISKSSEELLILNKILVYPFTAGSIDEVLHGWLNGTINDIDFMMPGCWYRKRRNRCKKRLRIEHGNMKQHKKDGKR